VSCGGVVSKIQTRGLGAEIQEAETGWKRVDNQLAQLRERFATARSVEDFQALGLLCRDIFISLAEATFADEHLPKGEEIPGSADAKRRLAMVVDAVAAGVPNRELRVLLKANLDLANKVQHTRAATLDEAAIVAEATVVSVNLMRVLILGAAPIEPSENVGEAEPENGLLYPAAMRNAPPPGLVVAAGRRRRSMPPPTATSSARPHRDAAPRASLSRHDAL
jgi:hypothetical protein